MKKYLLLLAGMLESLHSFSQEDEVITSGTTKINRQLTPQQIIDSLNKTFPDAIAIEYFMTPGDAVKEGWTITKDDQACEEDFAYYIISFKRAYLKYYGLFAPDGKLLIVKIKQDLWGLPDPIKQSLLSLGKGYQGYRLLSKTYYKNENQYSHTEYYEVIAQRGSDRKRLFL
jgi:hypothetical protein